MTGCGWGLRLQNISHPLSRLYVRTGRIHCGEDAGQFLKVRIASPEGDQFSPCALENLLSETLIRHRGLNPDVGALPLTLHRYERPRQLRFLDVGPGDVDRDGPDQLPGL